MSERPVQLSIWDNIPVAAPPPEPVKPAKVERVVDHTPVTHESLMTFGRYKDQPVKNIPYDYLLDLYILNGTGVPPKEILTGGLLKYVEQLIDETKGDYNNLIYHK